MEIMRFFFEGMAKMHRFIDAPYNQAGIHEEDDLSYGMDKIHRLIEGDNLDTLRAMQAEYSGQVKCIYIDPPYNTGNKNWIYDDAMKSSQKIGWLQEVLGEIPKHKSDQWLCWMMPRLHQLRELLSNDGAIFISIDDREYHHLRLLCDDVFGINNFVNDIVWQKKSSANNANGIACVHEYIIVYAKNRARFSWRNPEFEGLFGTDISSYQPSTVWSLKEVGSSGEGTKEARQIFANIPMKDAFPTVKPMRLIARILELASTPGDLILDAFAGTGTTGHAVLQLNQNNCTSPPRRFVLCEEVPKVAQYYTRERLVRAISGYGKFQPTGGGFTFERCQ